MAGIKELIVVEGKNDAHAVHRAYPDADVMITGGWGLSNRQIQALKKANQSRGVIIFTDPDYAGEQIRRRLQALLPGCRHAFLPRALARVSGKVGVELADITSIRHALSQVRSPGEMDVRFTREDLLAAGLMGAPGAAAKREQLAALLSIGYGNSKNFLWRLNALGVSREEFIEAVGRLEAEESGSNQTN